MNKKIIFWAFIGLGVFLEMIIKNVNVYAALGSTIVTFAISLLLAWVVLIVVGSIGSNTKSFVLWDKLLVAAVINLGYVILLDPK